MPAAAKTRKRTKNWMGVLVFGAFVAIFMIYWMTVPISGGLSMLQEQKAFGWGLIIVFGLVGMGGLLLALCIVVAGLCLLTNSTRCVIELRKGKLWSIERLGPVRLRRKRPVNGIRRFAVIPVSEMDDRENGAWSIVKAFDGSLEALVARGGDGGEFASAVGYPREMLLGLGKELAERVGAESPEQRDGDSLDWQIFEEDETH